MRFLYQSAAIDTPSLSLVRVGLVRATRVALREMPLHDVGDRLGVLTSAVDVDGDWSAATAEVRAPLDADIHPGRLDLHVAGPGS